MDRRLIKSTVNFSGKIEVAMRQLLEGATPIPLVELGTLNGFSETVEFQATMKNLMLYETKLAKAGAIGYRFRPDFRLKKILFETYKGTDRTTAQGVNSRVIFSESYNNLNNVIYKYNDQQYRTKAIVGGKRRRSGPRLCGSRRRYRLRSSRNIRGRKGHSKAKA